MLTAVYVMLGLALVLGILLGYSALKFKVEGDPLVARIDAILPQTQCGQCGFGVVSEREDELKVGGVGGVGRYQ